MLNAYCQGYFPMADGRGGELGWYSPDPRAIQPFLVSDPLGSFHIRHSLAKQARKGGYQITTNLCFANVIHECATVPRKNELDEEAGTWISPEIETLYTQLHDLGYAHSVEAWHEDELVGGVYGVCIGAAFFGESMFSTRPYASQLCYIHLIEKLRVCGYTLLDVQFVNPHIAQFGVVEIPRDDYLRLLQDATRRETQWADHQ